VKPLTVEERRSVGAGRNAVTQNVIACGSMELVRAALTLIEKNMATGVKVMKSKTESLSAQLKVGFACEAVASCCPIAYYIRTVWQAQE